MHKALWALIAVACLAVFALVLFVPGPATGSLPVANEVELAEIERYHARETAMRKILENEPLKRWKEIGWLSDLSAAREQARKEGKPILALLLVNENGVRDAEHC